MTMPNRSEKREKNIYRGALARRQGQDWENQIESQFSYYFRGQVANLAIMPVPTKGTMQGGKFVRVQTGCAPFDIYGFTMSRCNGWSTGTFIGAEMKHTLKFKTSLPITDESGGLLTHQLIALEEAAASGSIARILWQNEREIGLLEEEGVMKACRAMLLFQKTRGTEGRMSIPWESFRKIGYQAICGSSCVAWLPVRPEPTAFRTSLRS